MWNIQGKILNFSATIQTAGVARDCFRRCSITSISKAKIHPESPLGYVDDGFEICLVVQQHFLEMRLSRMNLSAWDH
jgi:hypothetical protein